MSVSYSCHLSKGKHAITTASKLAQVARHNLRRYGEKKGQGIEVICGSNDLYKDVKNIYHTEFDEELKKYNEGVRSDRQIDDYFKHVSDGRGDLAAEIIIQYGDADYWRERVDFREEVCDAMRGQVEELRRLFPEFKIASAVVHFDETSPHMHVVGVPVATGYKKGMQKQVAKTKVFTRDRMSDMQDKMRSRCLEDVNDHRKEERLFYGYPYEEMELKEKGEGRNIDLPKELLGKLREHEDLTRQLDRHIEAQREYLDEVKEQTSGLLGAGEKVMDFLESLIELILAALSGLERKKLYFKRQGEEEDIDRKMDKLNTLYDELMDYMSKDLPDLERELDYIEELPEPPKAPSKGYDLDMDR